MNTEARLKALCASSDWVEVVYPAIVDLKLDGQRQIAAWGALINSTELFASLDRVSTIVDAFDVLQRAFLRWHRSADGAIDKVALPAVVAVWDELVTAAIRVEEDLERATGREGWRSAREQLSSRGLESLELRDADIAALRGKLLTGDEDVRDRTRDLADLLPSAYSAKPWREATTSAGGRSTTTIGSAIAKPGSIPDEAASLRASSPTWVDDLTLEGGTRDEN
jgi:hypothetical protein